MTALGDKAIQLAQSLIRCESVTPADAGALDVLIQALKPARLPPRPAHRILPIVRRVSAWKTSS